jgi:hypothetical protein
MKVSSYAKASRAQDIAEDLNALELACFGIAGSNRFRHRKDAIYR